MSRARATAAVAAVALTAAATLLALGARHHAAVADRGAHLYVDCSRSAGGDGTVTRPWNRLSQANAALLGPGAWLSLRRGTACAGELAPRGSGTARQPIQIGAYGTGPAPRIAASGRFPDALRIADQAHVVVQDLELTNHADGSRILRGLHAVQNRPGALHDIVIRRLYVHDVGGADVKGQGGSGGIQVDDPTSNVLIQANRVEDVNRSGIWIAGAGRPPRPPAGTPWPTASIGIVIAGNVVSRVGGDGIVPTGTAGAVVAGNVVCCANLRGRPGVQFDAGIWTFDANGTVIENNVVHDMANPTADGNGYDIDYAQDGTIVQYNLGYRNAGGFILLCTDSEPRHAQVRFNLSLDEYALAESPCTVPAGTLTGIRVYNNTFLTPTAQIWHAHQDAISTLQQAGGFQFFNNIVAATTQQHRRFPCGTRCSHNLFWGLPASGSTALRADPRFVGSRSDPSATADPRLRLAAAFRVSAGSPALSTGTALPNAPATDYFGSPLTDPPTIGFAQGAPSP